MKKNKGLWIGIPLAVLLAAAVIYQYGYLHIRDELNRLREEEEGKTRTLEKYLAVIAERPFLEKKRETLEEWGKTERSNLVSGETYSLAAAALQEMVKGIITGRNGVISSERMGKEEDFQSPSPSPPGERQEGMKKAPPGTKAPATEEKKAI